MIRHLSASIYGLLAMNDKDLMNICQCGTDENGNHPSVNELRAYLFEERAKGHKFIPSEGCDNFDPVCGCMGHPSKESE